MSRERQLRIRFYESALGQHGLFMNPSTIQIVEQTIKDLEKLDKLGLDEQIPLLKETDVTAESQ